MTTSDRRQFLKLIGAGAAASTLPTGIARALEIPAAHRTGTIDDVEHIIILTQENRSFDHYFGSLRGVRGFADPRTVRLPSGKSVWHQADGAGEVLPFRPPVNDLGLTFLPDPAHGWNDTHAAWNQGRHDQWIPNKGVTAMTYHLRKDLPYHYALADAFTVCDAYHCSVMGPTDPNRYHLWTGWLGNDGRGGGPVITNAEVGYDWSSYPERLLRAGISCKVYQDIGDGLDAAGAWGWTGNDPYIGNYGDNALLYLHQYQNARPGEPLADFAKVGTNIKALDRDPQRLLDQFRADVGSGKLPQVSWIAPPEAFSEHPNFPGGYGAWYTSQVIDILAAHPEVWSKTALFINFDEEGGFFDHMVPPTPAPTPDQGASTVDIVNEIYPGDPGHPSAPYGLGMRVPMVVVSPWSKGGWVNSQVFDHTSLIRFLEARFSRHHPDLIESNITPWRRAVTGDLTTAFDFAKPHGRAKPRLPSTLAFLPPDLVRHDDLVVVSPPHPSLPEQEPGVRPARPLPYELHAHGSVSAVDGSFVIAFDNSGGAGAVFHVRDLATNGAPRSYTVEAGKQLSGHWPANPAGGLYDLEVHGPNGFLRAFKGSTQGSPLSVRVDCDAERESLTLAIENRGHSTAHVRVFDQYRGESVSLELRPGNTVSRHWSLERQFGWYDLTVTVQGDSHFQRQFAGHIETGHASISDPRMGRVGFDN